MFSIIFNKILIERLITGTGLTSHIYVFVHTSVNIHLFESKDIYRSSLLPCRSSPGLNSDHWAS